MTMVQPEDMTLEEIKEQLALYNRLYCQKRRHEKDFMETKRLSAIKYHRRKKLNEMVDDGKIELKDINYENKNENENDKPIVKATKPRKYKGTTYNIISTA
jgi:hypothetical protein